MKKEYTNCTLEELELLTEQYEEKHNGINEFDTSINSISRAKIEVFCKQFEVCYMGKVNDCSKDPSCFVGRLVPYEGQFIHKFQYDFIIAVKDEKLTELIQWYNQSASMKELYERCEEVLKRIDKLKGLYLLWS